MDGGVVLVTLDSNHEFIKSETIQEWHVLSYNRVVDALPTLLGEKANVVL